MKLFKKDTKPFLNVLHKLTDNRFSFNIVKRHRDNDFKYDVEMSFCGDYVASSEIIEFHQECAFDCLIDLIQYADKQNRSDYFSKLGVSFEIYHNKLNGKNYFSFRKNDSDKWVNINQGLASYILEQNDIEIDGLCDNVVSCCEYDTYYKVCLKGA